jgi:polyhydroxybutyrate depolymerase
VVKAFLAPWGGGIHAKPAARIGPVRRRHLGPHHRISLKGRVVLRLITVEGGAHHWPGGRKARLGEGKTQEIDANREILRFFQAIRSGVTNQPTRIHSGPATRP